MSRQDIGINQQRLLKAFHGRYLLTGDLAKWTTMAIYLLLTVKEFITGGENVLPSEVENALAEHPLVDRCVVVGYDHQNMVSQCCSHYTSRR